MKDVFAKKKEEDEEAFRQSPPPPRQLPTKVSYCKCVYCSVYALHTVYERYLSSSLAPIPTGNGRSGSGDIRSGMFNLA